MEDINQIITFLFSVLNGITQVVQQCFILFFSCFGLFVLSKIINLIRRLLY